MILVRKIIKIPDFFNDICPKNLQNSRILRDFCPKNARILHNICPKNILSTPMILAFVLAAAATISLLLRYRSMNNTVDTATILRLLSYLGPNYT